MKTSNMLAESEEMELLSVLKDNGKWYLRVEGNKIYGWWLSIEEAIRWLDKVNGFRRFKSERS